MLTPCVALMLLLTLSPLVRARTHTHTRTHCDHTHTHTHTAITHTHTHTHWDHACTHTHTHCDHTHTHTHTAITHTHTLRSRTNTHTHTHTACGGGAPNQDPFCVSGKLTGLDDCTSKIQDQDFCGSECESDLRTAYSECGFTGTTNPVAARESLLDIPFCCSCFGGCEHLTCHSIAPALSDMHC